MAPKTVSVAPPRPAVSAVEMGARQREISVSEFFTKNRHLLGFDNPRKALLTCVKEAVDNALDRPPAAAGGPSVEVSKLGSIAVGISCATLANKLAVSIAHGSKLQQPPVRTDIRPFSHPGLTRKARRGWGESQGGATSANQRRIAWMPRPRRKDPPGSKRAANV